MVGTSYCTIVVIQNAIVCAYKCEFVLRKMVLLSTKNTKMMLDSWSLTVPASHYWSDTRKIRMKTVKIIPTVVGIILFDIQLGIYRSKKNITGHDVRQYRNPQLLPSL